MSLGHDFFQQSCGIQHGNDDIADDHRRRIIVAEHSRCKQQKFVPEIEIAKGKRDAKGNCPNENQDGKFFVFAFLLDGGRSLYIFSL